MARHLTRLYPLYMKPLLPSITRALVVLVLGTMTSCVMYDDGYNQPFYGDSGGYSEPYIDSGVYDRPFYGNPYPRNYGLFSSNYYRGFGGGFRDPYCNDYDPRYVHGGNSRYSPPRNDGKVDRNNLRIVGGDLDGKVKPQGTHSSDWYRSRGYDLKKLKVEDEDGTRYRPTSTKSKSSSSSRPPPPSMHRPSSLGIKTVSSHSVGRPPSPSRPTSNVRSSSSSSRGDGESKSKSSSSNDRKESSGGISRKR